MALTYPKQEAEVYEESLENLWDLPFKEEIATGTTEYNTASALGALEALRDEYGTDARFDLKVHDEASGLMMTIYGNEGHSPGIGLDYFLDTLGDGSFTDRVHKDSRIGELGDIDWFQINVYHDWRK
jgi:hypothetical protein